MSSGPSLYRRHRPRTFADVVGQEHVVRTLSHAVEGGKVHHAYLFVGSRGTGKTSMAKILAACLNCVNGPTVTPCGVCDSCVSIASATSLDVIEMDAASNNSVDDIRELREKVAYAPVSGRHKVYILDEAHMLSPQAWNAFLKTLEEPPPRTIFVLATTEAQKVLPTVVDRCHRFDFGRPSAEQVAAVVRRVAERESIVIDDGAAALVARHATGSFRDALGTLEQLVTYAGEEPIRSEDVLAVLGVADAEQLFGAVEAIVARDPAGGLRAAAGLASSGRDPGQVLRDLEVHGRELLTVQILGEVPPELRVTADRDARLLQQAGAVSQADAVRLLELVSAALEATSNGADARIQLELVLIKAASPEVDPSVQALLSRMERLEARLASHPSEVRVEFRSPPEQNSTRNAQGTATDVSVSAPEPEPREPEPPVQPQPLGDPAPLVEAEPSNEPEPAAPVTNGAPLSNGASASAPGGAPSLDIAHVVSLWPAVIDLVRGGNQMLAALLIAARPVAVTERELTVAFPAEQGFAKRKAEQEEYRRATADALRNVTGVALALRYELGDAAAALADAPELDETLSEDELVARFVTELGAQEIEQPDEEKA